MNDEEKARIRERLGARYFVILSEGLCPYCGRKLQPGREAGPALLENIARVVPPEMLEHTIACVPCESIWSEPVFGGDVPLGKMRPVWRSTSKKGRH